MNLLPVLLFSFAATSDSFVIGFHFGLKGVRMSFFSNLYISLVCFAGTAAAMLLGRWLGSALPVGLANLIGGFVLIGLGLWMLWEGWKEQDDEKNKLHGVCADPACVDKDDSKRVELRESMGIGLILCLNNMGLGIGAGIAGLPVMITSAICAVASFLFVGGGCQLGSCLKAGRLARALETISAFLILWLGVSSLV